MAVGTRTAPTVNGTPQYTRVSLSLIDNDGKIRTDSYQVPNASATAANIEALVAALQAVTAASVYAVEVVQSYDGASLRTNAVAQQKDSVADNIVVSTRAPAVPNSTLSAFIPAPNEALFTNDSATVDTANTALLAFNTAFITLAGTTGRIAQSVTFSQRRKGGARQKL